MEILLKILPIILYILLSILIVVLIILIFKAMNTLKKVDETLEDVNYKMGKLNGVFNLVDRSADAINILINDINQSEMQAYLQSIESYSRQSANASKTGAVFAAASFFLK